MKNLRHILFGAAEVKALPAPAHSAPPELAHEFRRALFGRSCRTIAFAETGNPYYSNSYMKAANVTGDEWSIMRVYQAQSDTFGQVNISPVIRDKLTFFEALQQLAYFEKGQDANAEQAGAKKEDLGFDHYEAFARREGIAIDLIGQPHPTLKGEIVTTGTFAGGEETAARAAWIEREKQQRRITVDLPALVQPVSGTDREEIAGTERDYKIAKSTVDSAEVLMIKLLLCDLLDYKQDTMTKREAKKVNFKKLTAHLPVEIGAALADFTELFVTCKSFSIDMFDVPAIAKEFDSAFKGNANNNDKYAKIVDGACLYGYRSFAWNAAQKFAQNQSHQNAENFLHLTKRVDECAKRLGMESDKTEYSIVRPEFPTDFLLKLRQHSRDLSDGLDACKIIKTNMVRQMVAQKLPLPALPAPKAGL